MEVVKENGEKWEYLHLVALAEKKMTDKKEKEQPALDPELDSLLDDALEDFTKPIEPPAATPAADSTQASSDGAESATAGWTDEFIQQATSNIEKTLRSLMEQQVTQQGGEPNPEMESVDMEALSSEFTRLAATAAKAVSETPPDSDFAQSLSETMKKLSENKEELQAVPTADDVGKLFEGLGLSDDQGSLGALFPLMQVMLENILSKDVLYPPMKEITDKYPDWLADNRSKLSDEEYDRYNKQYDIMKQVVQLFEDEKEDETDEAKSQRFEKILLSMQKLQEVGQPPKDLVGDVGPLINFDEAGNPVIPDMSALMGMANVPGTQGGSGSAEGLDPQMPQNLEGNEQCRIM